MKKFETAQALIESGILETYVLEQASSDEIVMVEEMIAQFPELKMKIEEISIAFENYAIANAVQPNNTVKPFVMATLNFMKRMEAGEQAGFPPVISIHSTFSDYEEWTSRADLQLKDELDGTFAYIIGYTPQMVSAIAWIAPGMVMAETHHNEHEKFFILEGSCCITFNNIEHHLTPGQTLEIPLYVEHTVRITSPVPCKVILQRLPLAA